MSNLFNRSLTYTIMNLDKSTQADFSDQDSGRADSNLSGTGSSLGTTSISIFTPSPSPTSSPDLYPPQPPSQDLFPLNPSAESYLPANPVNNLPTELPWYCQPYVDPAYSPDHHVETVQVQNASIVAQIVGKAGCKIAPLKQKYSVKIHSPPVLVEGELPVFKIWGSHPAVIAVKAEIEKAARYFEGIARERKERIDDIMAQPDASILKVFVPHTLIGAVVGRNGTVVRHLQRAFSVHIDTPKEGQEGYFLVRGPLPAVHCVAKQMLEHISKVTCTAFNTFCPNKDEIHFVQ